MDDNWIAELKRAMRFRSAVKRRTPRRVTGPEPLEDRCVPATLWLNSTNDDVLANNELTLRAA